MKNFKISFFYKLNISILLWIILLLFITKISGEVIFRVDPLALLSATLRTYQRAACDTDQVTLSCPRGTSISIEIAQYGKTDGKDGITIEDLCPSTDGQYAALNEINNNNNNNNNNSSKNNKKSNKRTNRQNNSSLSKNINTGGSGGGNSNSINPSSYSSSTNSNISNVVNDTSSKLQSSATTNGNEITTNTRENCVWPNALQYSLLQTVVEACQKKKHCKFNAYPGTYRGGSGNSGVGIADSSSSSSSSGTSSFYGSSSTTSISAEPCPRIRKLVEIAYKCRPYEFRSKVACENDVIQLECNPYSRIAVYSASFGRTEYESIQCPQPQGVKEETCLASYATETVMQICHGRRRCNLSADSSTFGSPCHPNSRMYLKVVYTCVPKQVLKDRYESEAEPDEPEHFDGDTSDLYDEDQFYKESEAIPKLQSNLTRTSSGGGLEDGDGSITTTQEPGTSSSNPLMTQAKESSLEDDQERLYFYLLISGCIGVVLCIIIVAVRVLIQNHRNRSENQTSSPKGETTIPNGFNDSISEIDADIDLTTPVPVPSVSKNENYIACGPSASLYGSLGPSNVSHTSSTMLLATNSMMCARQSPDIIGVSNTFVGQPSHVNSSIGTIVPIGSLAQYTSAPTFHTGYIMDPEGVLRRPISSATHPTLVHSPQLQQQQQQQQANQQQNQQQQQQQQQQPLLPPQSHPAEQQFQYDGTAPRTLSTGVAHNSQFYYG